jgi:hypothetical protein
MCVLSVETCDISSRSLPEAATRPGAPENFQLARPSIRQESVIRIGIFSCHGASEKAGKKFVLIDGQADAGEAHAPKRLT